MKKRVFAALAILFALGVVLVIAMVLKSWQTASPDDVELNYTSKYGPVEANVILIIIDTLRPDHLGCYGYFRDTSPNIDALTQRSFVFNNAYAASSWTRPSIASIVSSQLPLEHGIYSEGNEGRLQEEAFTIQDFFKAREYATAAFYSNPQYNFGVVQTFDYTHYVGNQSADRIYGHALDWLEANSDKRFFLLIHNNDPHDKYEFHEGFSFTARDSEYRALDPLFPVRIDGSSVTSEDREGIVVLDKEQLAEMEANYDGEIAFTDHHLGRLIDYLKQNDLDKNTVVIITADHGEEFLDHGGYWHGCTLYNELIRVPLIICLPGGENEVVEEAVSLIDIFPTVVDIVEGDSGNKYDLTGQSLLPLIEEGPWREKPIFSATAFRGPLKYSLIDGRHKMIRYASGDVVGYYDLKDDPNELHSLDPGDSLPFRLMSEELSRLIEKTKITDSGEATLSQPDEQNLKDLRSLGYAE